jgi:hypothetical protein
VRVSNPWIDIDLGYHQYRLKEDQGLQRSR